MFNKYSAYNMEGATRENENELEVLTYKLKALKTNNDDKKRATFLEAASDKVILEFRKIKEIEKKF